TNGNGSAEIPFSQSGSANLFRVSNSVGQSHALTFTWNGSVRSNSCEAAVRMGENSGSTTGCDACGYGGSPSRTQSSDGHFVTVTFTSLCGNGVVDSSVGEACDTGISGSACCGSNCQFLGTSTVCRASSGVCDPQEVCPGNSATCPGNA